MARHMKFWQGVMASILLLQLGASASLAQDFYFGNFEQDVQFNGQYILDQNAPGYAGWFDWAEDPDAGPEIPSASPSTTVGVTTGVNSIAWQPNTTGYHQGLAAQIQHLPAATRDAFFDAFFRNTHLAMNVTWDNNEWDNQFNADGWNGAQVGLIMAYGPGGTLEDQSFPDVDTGNGGTPGHWDLTNYPGVHSRVVMWDYSAHKAAIQSLYNSGDMNETNGWLQFMLWTNKGDFNLPVTFYIDSWRLTSPNAVGGSVQNYQLPDAATWPGTPVHTTTTTSTNLQANFNTEATIGPNGGVSHTFTPDTTIKLDGFAIRAAGAPTTGELYLYRNPVGGSEADGFVNNGFSEGVLLEALPFTFDGTETRTFLVFDLLDEAEVTLEAGVEYSIDLRNTGEMPMYWMRSTAEPFLNAYTGGNIYARNPIEEGDEGERFDVSGAGRRDGTLALYAVLPAAGFTGDYNGDGSVDAADYTVWRNNLGQPGSTLLNRDPANGDGVVDQNDYTSWKTNFGAGGNGSLTSVAVPEPAGWVLGLAAFTALGVARRHK